MTDGRTERKKEREKEGKKIKKEPNEYSSNKLKVYIL